MADRQLSQAAVDVLDRVSVEGTHVRLPAVQLPRKLYEEVNEVLARLGGKWTSGKTKAHVFASDPTNGIRMVVESGELPPKNPLAFFPTPPDVVDRMVALAGAALTDARLVLEPSAGDGAILRRLVAPEPLFRIVHAVELDATRCASLRTAGYSVSTADFLSWAPTPAEVRYHAVLMNPPFTALGDPLAYIPHIRHAFSLVAPRGVLVSVAPNGFTTRQDRRCSGFRAFVNEHGTWEPLPAGAFKESGTAASCVLIRLVRHG